MPSKDNLSPAELNSAALDVFVTQPVNRQMITYLANAAYNVIQCDATMMPPPASERMHKHSRSQQLPPTPPKTPPPRAVRSDDSGLPSLEEFITSLVVGSQVQVPTLMSTLVYLNRLKARLQPMAKGLRCTTHRIFLASLILAAKYLNDSSPKNKHWANYSVVSTDVYQFGFSRTEVNLMEKQLLFLLDWDLRITEEDLYRELDWFLAPLRRDISERHARRQQERRRRELERRKEEEERRRRMECEQDQLDINMWAYAAAAQGLDSYTPFSYAQAPSAAYSERRGHSRTRSHSTRRHTPSVDSVSSTTTSPPELTYSSSHHSSASSYASSLSSGRSSRMHSRATTPLPDPADVAAVAEPYVYETSGADGDLYEPPVEIVLEAVEQGRGKTTRASSPTPYDASRKQQLLLPYEISAEELRDMQEGAGASGRSMKRVRGMLGRVFGSTGAYGGQQQQQQQQQVVRSVTA